MMNRRPFFLLFLIPLHLSYRCIMIIRENNGYASLGEVSRPSV